MTKQDVYKFLNEKLIGVISTLNEDNSPESAVIGFGQTRQLEIIFATEESSRKYSNLIRNPKVAFVIGWENGETMQYQGKARQMGLKDMSLIEDNYWQKNPRAKKYHSNSEKYFIVKPEWIRHTDLKTKPWKISEISL